jgi:hypothetical protein
MSQSINHTTASLAKILDPVAACFTPEVAKRGGWRLFALIQRYRRASKNWLKSAMRER